MSLLYCFTSGVAYAGWFRAYQNTGAYWLGVLALALFNVVICSLFKEPA